ncbi:MAG: hypothetical protein U0637_06600 [Phycisphaerales bacterium]
MDCRRVHAGMGCNVRKTGVVVLCAFAGLAVSPRAHAQALTTAFTYQGELQNGGAPADGAFDLRFRLYDAVSGGGQLGTTQCVDNVTVVGGKFTVQLDFGGQFAGQQRFLDIQVRADTGQTCANAAGFTVLTPRQALTATPYAVYAPGAGNAVQLNGQGASYYQDAGNLASGTVPDGRLAPQVVRTVNSNTFSGTNTFAGFTTFTGAVQSTNPASVYLGDGAGLSGLWRLGGNSGTNPATQFLGTTDNQEVNVRANNRRAATVTPASVLYGAEPAVTPSINLGADNNYIAPGVAGATIGGGGLNTVNNATLANQARNSVFAHMGTIGGGFGNKIEATGVTSTIGGGEYNVASGVLSAVGGGSTNVASGVNSFIGGGMNNQASADQATIAGGRNNIVSTFDGAIGGGAYNVASGAAATVPGGYLNVAQGGGSVAMGSRAQALHDGAFVWGDNALSDFASTGPNQFLIRAGGGVGINTNTMVGAASLVVRGTAAGNSWSGMYADTPDSNGIPFLGYASAGVPRAWTQYNAGTSEWSLITGSGGLNPIRSGPSGNVTFGNWVGIRNPSPDAPLSFEAATGSKISLYSADNVLDYGLGIASGVMQFYVDNPSARFDFGYDTSLGAVSPVRVYPSYANGTGSVPQLVLQGQIEPGGLSLEAGGGYTIINMDNNFRVPGRNSQGPQGGAEGGAVRIDARPNQPMFQFWRRTTGANPVETLSASLASNGNFIASGTITGTAKFFQIDHPSDPANKTLRHACIESDEYKNIYDGVVTTDGAGYATIQLPSWMSDLNEHFRYQLTIIDEGDSGDPLMWARVVRKVDASNTFVIRTSGGGLEVSWQVTGTRKDAWAKANPFAPEEEKSGVDKGRYLSPEAFGRPASEGIHSQGAFEARAAVGPAERGGGQ